MYFENRNNNETIKNTDDLELKENKEGVQAKKKIDKSY